MFGYPLAKVNEKGNYVGPYLAYIAQFWAPNYIKEEKKLEQIQRRATILLPALKHLPYKERLKRLNIFFLKKR